MNPQFISEFLGTAILILLGDGVCAAVNLKKSKAEASGWIVITVGWAMAVAMAAYISGTFGPAHLNPALTIAMAFAGKIGWGMVVPFIIAQLLGAIVGAVLVWLAYLPHWGETKDQGAILGTFATGPAIRNYPANVMTEAIGTFILVLGILCFGVTGVAPTISPLVVAALILSLGVSLGGPTGYAINPARDLGPRIAHQILPIPTKGSSDWSYAWVPIVGPVIGGVLAAVVFGLLPL